MDESYLYPWLLEEVIRRFHAIAHGAEAMERITRRTNEEAYR